MRSSARHGVRTNGSELRAVGRKGARRARRAGPRPWRAEDFELLVGSWSYPKRELPRQKGRDHQAEKNRSSPGATYAGDEALPADRANESLNVRAYRKLTLLA